MSVWLGFSAAYSVVIDSSIYKVKKIVQGSVQDHSKASVLCCGLSQIFISIFFLSKVLKIDVTNVICKC